MTEQWGNYNPPGDSHPFHHDDPALEDWPDVGEDAGPDIELPTEPDDADDPAAEHDPGPDDEG